jgi:ubiquinone/menaquinone biosynthesis C-methylase UbiE
MKNFAITSNRELKAKKIEAVLSNSLKKEIKGFRILDVGAGSGEIIDYFAKRNYVHCVDLEDQRVFKKAEFRKVDSAKLPFKKQSFDIVISNHVIEHLTNQNLHLMEINRVLSNGGVCYLATPNRNFLVEPHYKIPLIHYMPSKLFYKILIFFKIYKEDVHLLTFKLLRLLVNKYFISKDYTPNLIKYPNKYYLKWNIFSWLPMGIIKKIYFMSPTVVFILSKKHTLN